MIDLEIVVVFDGEKVTLSEVKPADFVHLERHFGLSLPKLGGELTFEQLCYVAWRQLRRHRGDVGDFNDEFLERIDNIEPAAAPAPFVPADGPSPGP